MAVSLSAVSVPISASTSSAQGTYPAGSSSFVRVVNGSSAVCYCASGSNPTATSANVAVGPNATEIFVRSPDDAKIAVLLSASTGTVSVSLCSPPGE